jgi:hypothetical protein
VLSTLHRLLSVGLVLVALGGVMFAVVRVRAGAPGARLLRLSWTAVGLLAVDGIAGAALWLGRQRPAEPIHPLVGALALLALLVPLALGARAGGRARSWLLLGGWILLFGLCLRAVGTGAAVQ